MFRQKKKLYNREEEREKTRVMRRWSAEPSYMQRYMHMLYIVRINKPDREGATMQREAVPSIKIHNTT